LIHASAWQLRTDKNTILTSELYGIDCQWPTG
jgi:hypothetical protein